MASMSVSLPDKMRDFIKSRIQSGDYHNESEYIRDLIRRDKEKLVLDTALLSTLEKSEASGISPNDLPGIMKRVRDRQCDTNRL